MTHASVFSGIGGPEVAAAMLGWENLFHCEINPFGRAVLQYWFPKSKSYEDITKTDFSEWGGRVNVLTGGFPCQPFSYAGQRRGSQDDRYLWPFMHRCINQVRPDWVVCENVAGILTMVEQGDVTQVAAEKSLFDEGDTLYRYRLDETFTLERICNDLENDGYAVQAVVIPACAVNAPHRRDRVFIIGRRDASDTSFMHLDGSQSGDGCDGSGEPKPELGSDNRKKDEGRTTAHTESNGGDRVPTGEGGQAARQDGQLDAEPAINGGVLPRTSPAPDCNRGGEMDEHLQPRLADGSKPVGNGGERIVTDTSQQRGQRNGFEQPGTGREKQEQLRGRSGQDRGIAGCGRWDTFPTVSPVHRGNDGIPFPLDDLTISPSKWRTESLKAYGNAIVPQVMYEIFKAIEETYK